MRKKVYQEPTTTVVKLQQAKMLMSSKCGVGAERSGYGEANDGTENSNGIWIWD